MPSAGVSELAERVVSLAVLRCGSILGCIGVPVRRGGLVFLVELLDQKAVYGSEEECSW